MTSYDVFESLIIECNEALFESYGLTVEHSPNAEREEIWEEDLSLAGIIGFTSKELRGSLVLGVSDSILAKIDASATSHRDWIQELANQLLGRAKNRLLRFGVEIQMTTPLSMRGLHLVLEARSAEARPLLFRTRDGGAICALPDVEIKPGFELVEDPSLDAECPSEGDMLLF